VGIIFTVVAIITLGMLSLLCAFCIKMRKTTPLGQRVERREQEFDAGNREDLEMCNVPLEGVKVVH
jgi:hypothetical protein